MSEIKQKVMDDVIDFLSGGKLENYSDEAIEIMNRYSIKWNKSDADYDSKEGAAELDKIIDDCIDEVLKLDNIFRGIV